MNVLLVSVLLLIHFVNTASAPEERTPRTELLGFFTSGQNKQSFISINMEVTGWNDGRVL